MKKLIIISILSAFLWGCVEQPALKAPCNDSGSNCSPRTKINQWSGADNS